ncbi:MAG: HEPN domain-containing protein [Bacteroidota bacterium]
MTGAKADYINYRIEKSKEVFEDAVILAEKKRWNSCVNRLYYSSFHLVNALLFKNGINAQTHSGIKTQFSNHFVKTGKLSIECGRLYSHLIDWRQESDYVEYTEFDEQTVVPLIEKVMNLNSEIIKAIAQE